MIVLGVDPGSVRTGWGVVRRAGPGLQWVGAGVITAPEKAELHVRLQRIHAGLCEVIAQHAPDAMAVEDVFSKHASSALKLGQARGVVLLAGANAELSISSYPPAVVKRSIAGKGAAPKEQLARIVGAMLKLKQLPPVDATDALAIAITHVNASRVLGPR